MPVVRETGVLLIRFVNRVVEVGRLLLVKLIRGGYNTQLESGWSAQG